MEEKETTFNHHCIEALYRRQLTLGEALGFVSDLEVIRVFEHLCEIEKFIQLTEQTSNVPENQIIRTRQRLQSLKNIAAMEFFRRTQV